MASGRRRLQPAPSRLSPAPRLAPPSVKRADPRQRGYDSRWDVESKRFKQSNPLCLGCRAVGLVTATSVTDHTIPHRGDMALFWDRSKWQPSCGWHHDVVKQRLEQMFVAGAIDDDELRLDSETAMRLTRELLPSSPIR